MAFCTKCGAQVPDGTPFCTVCGAPMTPAPGPAPQQPPQQGQFMAPPPQQPYPPMPQQYRPAGAKGSDHTAEFAKDDIKKHKAIAASFYAMLMLLFFLTLDGIGFTTLFTSLIDTVTAMFTRSGWSMGSVGDIQALAFMGFFTFAGIAAFKDSPYVRFHGRMTFKLLALAILTYFLRIIPVVGPILCLVCTWLVIGVAFISFILVLMGKAREPIIVEYLFKE